MKNAIKTTSLLLIAVCLATASCKKKENSNPVLPPPQGKTITLKDMSSRYFIIKPSSASRKLVAVYFTEGGEKFLADGRGYRRGGSPALKDIDTVDGTALLDVDIDNNGLYVYSFKLVKNKSGEVDLVKTTYTSGITDVASIDMYDAADLGGFAFQNKNLGCKYTGTDTKSYIDTYKFSTDKCNFTGVRSSGALFQTYGSWDAGFYNIENSIGFKVDSKDVFGLVYMNQGGNMEFLIDNGNNIQPATLK